MVDIDPEVIQNAIQFWQKVNEKDALYKSKSDFKSPCCSADVICTRHIQVIWKLPGQHTVRGLSL